MQQTEKYQLNLIETSDTFSPAALNQNAQKVEDALAAETAARAAETAARQEADAALDARVTALEVKKIAAGFYAGDQNSDGVEPQFIDIGFTPAAVFVSFGHSYVVAAALGNPAGTLEVVTGGFQVKNNRGGSGSLNNSSYNYNYLALG